MNANVIVSLSLVVVGACVGIFIWMQANGETTDTISFVDACYEAYDGDAESIEICDTIAEAGITWDTEIACVASEDLWFGSWTLRGYYDATTGTVDASEEYFSSVCADVDTAVAFDDERKLWGWVGKVVKKAAVAVAQVFADATGTAVNFEGICSGDFKFAFLKENDTAECSGKHDECGKTGSCSDGKSCQAFNERGASYYNTNSILGKGCIDHDMCLQKYNGYCGSDCSDDTGATGAGCHSPYRNSGYGQKTNCDQRLVDEASKCKPFGDNTSTGTSSWHCLQVFISIGTKPNWDHCGYPKP